MAITLNIYNLTHTFAICFRGNIHKVAQIFNGLRLSIIKKNIFSRKIYGLSLGLSDNVSRLNLYLRHEMIERPLAWFIQK